MDRDTIGLIYGGDGAGLAHRLLEEFDISNDIRDVFDARRRVGNYPERRTPRIGIKPNLVLAVPACDGATTDPSVVEGIITYLIEHDFHDISIIESSWLGDDTARAFNVCGYTRLAENYPVRLIDLRTTDSIEIVAGSFRLRVFRMSLEFDYLINVPVLKAHCQTLMSCALKNLKGLIPDSEKRRYHSEGLHTWIARLNSVIKPDLILVDNLRGDLFFEEGGTPVRMERLFLAKDPVLADSYLSSLLGFEPSEIGYIGMAAELGAGTLFDRKKKRGKLIELNRPVASDTGRCSVSRIIELTAGILEKGACSPCYASLVFALKRLSREHGFERLQRLRERICIGQGMKEFLRGAKEKKSRNIGIGRCAAGCEHSIDGCPPDGLEVYKFLSRFMLYDRD